MADAAPVERVPLLFVYTCNHVVIGYFRRLDARPLNVSAMTGPSDPNVVWDILHPEDDPDVRPEVRPLPRICQPCTLLRKIRLRRMRRRYRQGNVVTLWGQMQIQEMERTNHIEDIVLMERALHPDLEGTKERLERRLIRQESPAADGNDITTAQTNSRRLAWIGAILIPIIIAPCLFNILPDAMTSIDTYGAMEFFHLQF